MHRCRVVGVLAAALALVAVAARGEPVVGALKDEDVVAKVNGTPIYRKAVREVVQGTLAAEDTAPNPNTIGKLAEDALDSLIDLEVLYQESQARHIKVSDALVEQEVARTRSHFATQREFDAALKERGMTAADLTRDTRKTMAVNALLEVTAWKDITITPEQIKDFYEKNQKEFKHPADIRASHILIRVPEKATPAARDAARKKATALLEQLKAGADFAQLARENSQDPGTAPQGGDLGYFSKGDMVEAFEKQAFALNPGQLSGVVTTPYGFHIIKVTDRRAAGYLPLADVQDRIRTVLEKGERQQRQADLVAELRKTAKIEYAERKD